MSLLPRVTPTDSPRTFIAGQPFCSSEPYRPVRRASTTPPSCRVRPALPLSPRKRSEEHTSELQSRLHLVCRLLLEKKKKNRRANPTYSTATPCTFQTNGRCSVRPSITRRTLPADLNPLQHNRPCSPAMERDHTGTT